MDFRQTPGDELPTKVLAPVLVFKEYNFDEEGDEIMRYRLLAPTEIPLVVCVLMPVGPSRVATPLTGLIEYKSV